MSDRDQNAGMPAIFQGKLLSERSPHQRIFAALLFFSVLAEGSMAMAQSRAALPPLSSFVQAAREQNVDNREADITQQQRSAELDQTRFRLVPTLAVNGGYTFNQYPGSFAIPTPNGAPTQTITVTPQHQLEASVTLTVPLVDVGNWLRIGAAEANALGAQHRARATALSIERRVAQAYYQLIASNAVIESARRALQVAEANVQFVTQRMAGGFAGPLETERANSDVLRARQTVADATMQQALAAHSLQSLTGVVADGAVPALVATTEAPPTLESLRTRLSQLPSVRAAQQERIANERNESAGWMVLVPTVNATAQERFTNATGFAGQNAYFSAGVSLSWRADLSAVPAARALGTATAAARTRETRALQAAEDDLFEAWQRLRLALARSEAAHAQEMVSTRAVAQARDRLTAGTATTLDVLTLGRDAFAAEVARIQADADLLLARAVLRNASGYSLEGSAQ